MRHGKRLKRYRFIWIALGIDALIVLVLCLWLIGRPSPKQTTEPAVTAEPVPAATDAPEATDIPASTEPPTPEPAATDTPTSEPAATDTPTPEPAVTDTPTAEPTVTAAATEIPTAEPAATDTPTAEPTPLPADVPEPAPLDARLRDALTPLECLNGISVSIECGDGVRITLKSECSAAALEEMGNMSDDDLRGSCADILQQVMSAVQPLCEGSCAVDLEFADAGTGETAFRASLSSAAGDASPRLERFPEAQSGDEQAFIDATKALLTGGDPSQAVWNTIHIRSRDEEDRALVYADYTMDGVRKRVYVCLQDASGSAGSTPVFDAGGLPNSETLWNAFLAVNGFGSSR